MEDFEESKMARDNIKVFKDKLQISVLKTPHVVNDTNYKNENKFSFFYKFSQLLGRFKGKWIHRSIKWIINTLSKWE